MSKQEKPIYSLIPLEDFKALMGVDSREDKTASFCLTTATLNIERYCKRKLLRKKYFERIEFNGDLFLPLAEFPVTKILTIYLHGNGEILEPEFYNEFPDCGLDCDYPFYVQLSPAMKNYRGLKAVKVVYWAGYPVGKVPADLSAACAELAIWNMNRYRGRRVGMTGNIKGAGIQGEHFELFMPENVRKLLEPYRRKTI